MAVGGGLSASRLSVECIRYAHVIVYLRPITRLQAGGSFNPYLDADGCYCVCHVQGVARGMCSGCSWHL
jgi:hypothetical protein